MVGHYPLTRLRRLRSLPWIRKLVREHTLTPHDLIWPLFIREPSMEAEIPALPTLKRWTVEELPKVVNEAYSLGIPAVALFPVTPSSLKTSDGQEAWNPDNLICQAIRCIKECCPSMGIIADVALDPYTTHGHDGLIQGKDVANDPTIEALIRQSLNQAKAGADFIAPSDMMDGRIGAIRQSLDSQGYSNIGIISYAAKYASTFYGPFRQAIGAPSLTHPLTKETYQMDPANAHEAMREIQMDLQEGADMILIKPGLPYLDIICRAYERFECPILAYQVSGEYAMLKWAAHHGALNYDKALLESLIAFKRAGASAILTYGAYEAAQLIDS